MERSYCKWPFSSFDLHMKHGDFPSLCKRLPKGILSMADFSSIFQSPWLYRPEFFGSPPVPASNTWLKQVKVGLWRMITNIYIYICMYIRRVLGNYSRSSYLHIYIYAYIHDIAYSGFVQRAIYLLIQWIDHNMLQAT